jgi:hypothetical protein
MNDINRPPPKRLAVLRQLKDLLAGISEAEGDGFTMAGKVHINKLLFGQNIDANLHPPMLSIVEAPRPDFALFAGEGNNNRSDKWTLMIQGITLDDKTPNTSEDPYYLNQDVERRLARILAAKKSGTPGYPEWYRLGGIITTVEVAPPVIRPPEAQVSSHAFFYLPIRLGIAGNISE